MHASSTRLYAIDGILCTITTCGFYVLFLRVLNMGPTGYLLAIICADGLSALFLFAVTKTWRFLDFKRFDTKLLKKMLRYALPLVPASIFWWITNASDQFFVAAMLEDGTSWTAVLGASYKLPTILSIVSTIFTEAWQISAFTDGTDSQREQFFSRVFSAYQSLIFLAAAGIVLMGAALYGHLSRRLFYRLEIHPAFDDGNGICQLRQFFKQYLYG